MRRAWVICALLGGTLFAADTAVAPEYFRYSREVKVPASAGQAYVVVDQVMWEHMRKDLGDMRLYAGTSEIPFALQVQRGGAAKSRTPAKLLDLGQKGASTTFKLDAPVDEYDTIALDLKTKNFVTQASLEGSDDGSSWTNLTTATIFDFTDEKLGSNLEIRLRTPARFRHLQVTISDRVPVKDVVGASIAIEQARGASWVSIPVQTKIAQSGRETVIEWDSPEIPLERVQLSVGEPGLNFSRPAKLEDAEKRVVATGEIMRVHLKRGGRSIDREELGLDVAEAPRSKHYKLTIQNGDDRPLPISAVQPLSCERRVYFDPQGRTEFALYFGDEKVEPPVYDFARFFQEEPSAVRASLEPSRANAAYKGRPDDRPWSERNKWVLWAVLVVAVVGLGAVAVRGMVR